MKLTIEIKKFYGKKYVYGICKKSKQMLAILDVKTFTPKTLNILKRLGYTFEVTEIATKSVLWIA